jgi:pimeloyl-ACP methyl ester carboxylesterase
MTTMILALAMACAEMTSFQIPGASMSITKAEKVSDNLPPRCRIDGVIDQRTGVGGKAYGIGFALALPDNWNGRFLMQGGGGLNGSVQNPVGAQVSGDASALARGFAVVSTDTGHKGTGGFDSSFMDDQQAVLDFYFSAIGRVTVVAKEMITRYYGRAANHSYYVGCSTGGREAMLMSQRYPTYYDGIVAGDPAIRTGHSNLGLAYFAATINGVTPKLSESDKKLIVDSITKTCDEKDGLKDGLIFNSKSCDFKPSSLVCTRPKTDSCLSSGQAAGVEKAFAGPKDSRGNSIYPAFPFDAGIIDPGGIPGILLSGGRSPVNAATPSAEFDAEKAAWDLAANATARTGDSTWTNLSTFSGHGGKLIFYHGMSDPWFSPLDTVGYYEKMSKENGGADKVKDWSRLFLVPGMGHCNGGTATVDSFDMLTTIVDWVENGKAPESVTAKSRTAPSRTRPLCAYPAHAEYAGSGDPQSASSFVCR